MVHHKERVALISDSYGHPKEETISIVAHYIKKKGGIERERERERGGQAGRGGCKGLLVLSPDGKVQFEDNQSCILTCRMVLILARWNDVLDNII